MYLKQYLVCNMGYKVFAIIITLYIYVLKYVFLK